MGFPVILLPIHILLINLVTDGLPAIALGLEPKEDGIMEKNRAAPMPVFLRMDCCLKLYFAEF